VTCPVTQPDPIVMEFLKRTFVCPVGDSFQEGCSNAGRYIYQLASYTQFQLGLSKDVLQTDRQTDKHTET